MFIDTDTLLFSTIETRFNIDRQTDRHCRYIDRERVVVTFL